MTSPRPGENIGIAVVEIVVVAKEVVDYELLFLDVGRCPCSPAAHLLVKNWAAHAAAHHEVKHLAAVETGVQHTDADGDLRVVFAFKLANEVVGDWQRHW